MNIVIANGPGVLDNGQEVILFPSRWDSGIPHGKKPFAFYPYELATLSALLKRELPQHTIKFLDGNLESWDGDRYIQEIRKLRPDVLICECSALTYPTMTRVMRSTVRKNSIDADFQAILCGPMGAYDKERALADGWDNVVVGEYELHVLELLGGTVPPEAKVHGLINLDWLPWPEDEDVDRTRYREINHYIDYASDAAIVQMYLTRGCPLACSFCTVPNYYGGHGKSHRSHRCRNAEDVCEEILYLKAMHGGRMKGAFFNDEAHNANVEWLVELCEAFIRHDMKDKYNLRFDAMCGYWPMTEELVKLMAAAGYNQIRFGLESTSIVVGKKIGKAMHLGKLENFMGWLKRYGVHGYATIQIGAAGSTEETDRQTIADVKKWIAAGSISKWQISTSTPQPNTPFFQECEKNGWLTTTDFSLYDGYRAVVNFPDYPAERIQHVRNTCGL
jgi:radical SAM superfamily enzyme YgiQ (UPF0313 family)